MRQQHPDEDEPGEVALDLVGLADERDRGPDRGDIQDRGALPPGRRFVPAQQDKNGKRLAEDQGRKGDGAANGPAEEIPVMRDEQNDSGADQQGAENGGENESDAGAAPPAAGSRNAVPAPRRLPALRTPLATNSGSSARSQRIPERSAARIADYSISRREREEKMIAPCGRRPASRDRRSARASRRHRQAPWRQRQSRSTLSCCRRERE